MVNEFLDSLGLADPATYVVLFLAASMLMVWRLEALMEHGLEGTALGTLVMPYCSGFGNLVFVLLIATAGGNSQSILTNCVVNNTTNLTLILGLPALLWGLEVLPAAKADKGRKRRPSAKAGKQTTEQHLSRLSLLLTMVAVVFFSVTTWALAQDGRLDFGDGLVLVGIFLFWQCFQVFDVLKHNVRQRREFSIWLYVDLVVLLAAAGLLYVSLDWLVNWLSAQKDGFISAENLGWLSGWLMVLPNAFLALFYGIRGRADIVYSSQIGDGHICIPLCLGLAALVQPIAIPGLFEKSMLLILGATAVHFILVVVLGRLPRAVGALLIAAYGWFVYAGLLQG